jgi:phosphate/sulfate permease
MFEAKEETVAGALRGTVPRPAQRYRPDWEAMEPLFSGTIGGADAFGLPVSTSHVLSSGVAGTMAANRTGLQIETVRNLMLAWALTMPVSMVLAGSLFWLFNKVG